MQRVGNAILPPGGVYWNDDRRTRDYDRCTRDSDRCTRHADIFFSGLFFYGKITVYFSLCSSTFPRCLVTTNGHVLTFFRRGVLLLLML